MPGRSIIVLLAAMLIALATAGPVAAERARWTRGDAEAMLNTYPVSGDVLEDQVGTGLDIRPFAEFYASIPYCVEDWHVVALAFWEPDFVALGGQVVHTREEAWDFLSNSEPEFFLDGARIDIVTTRIRPANTSFAQETTEEYLQSLFGSDFEVGNIWSIQWGQVLAPDQMATGNHTLHVTVTYKPGTPDELVLFDEATPFTIYPADSAACTGG